MEELSVRITASKQVCSPWFETEASDVWERESNTIYGGLGGVFVVILLLDLEKLIVNQ